MEEIKMLYLVRGSESGGFIHISEKDVFEDSDAMDAKLVLAFKQHWTLESLLANKLTIRAINKQNELTLDVVLFPPSAEDEQNSALCTVETPYGFCWFKLKRFKSYIGKKLAGMKIYDLEPLSDAQLENLCINEQFFFVGC